MHSDFACPSPVRTAFLSPLVGVAMALALVALPALAQERAFELSQQTVITLHADGDDLWIGTEDGLNHLREGSVTQYRHDAFDAASLPGNKIRAIAPGPSGALWIAVANRGVVLWDPAGWVVDHRVALEGTALGNDARALLANPDGSVWAGFSRGGLELMQPEGVDSSALRRRSERARLQDHRVTALARAADGRIWVGTPSGIELYDPATRRSQSCASCSTPPVRSLQVTEQGLWAGTTRGTYLVRAGDRGLSASLVPGSTSRVNLVTADSQGNVWVGTSKGLLRVDTHSVQVTEVGLARRGGGVMAVHEDRDGELWIGTMTGGLRPFEQMRATSVLERKPEAAERNPIVVTSFAQTPSGRVFVGTMESGLMVQEQGATEPRFIRSDSVESLEGATVMTLLYDRQDHLWVGTKQGGLSRIDARTGEAVAFGMSDDEAFGLRAEGVMSLFEDADGAVWVGTFGGGLSKFDHASQTFRHVTAEHGLQNERVTTIAQARGGLWVGTLGGGLHLLDARQRVIALFSSAGEGEKLLPSDTIFSVYESEDGVIWVGSPAGLTRLERHKGAHLESWARTYTEADGLSNAAVYSVVPDDEGYLWLSTNSGLSRFDPVSETFEVFDESLGLQREYNFGAALKAQDGRLFFGGMDGYDAFHPTSLVEQSR